MLFNNIKNMLQLIDFKKNILHYDFMIFHFFSVIKVNFSPNKADITLVQDVSLSI